MKYKYKDGGIVKLQNAWTTMPSVNDAILRAWANQNTKEKAEKQVASEKPKYTYVNPYDYLHGWREATEDAAKQDKYTVENLGGSKEEAEAAYNAVKENAAKQLAGTTATGLGTIALLGLSGGAAGPVAADIVNTGFGAHGLYNALSGNGIQKTVRLANQGDTWGAVKSGTGDLIDLSLGLNAAKLWGNLGKSMLAGQSLGNAYRGNVAGREMSNLVRKATTYNTPVELNNTISFIPRLRFTNTVHFDPRVKPMSRPISETEKMGIPKSERNMEDVILARIAKRAENPQMQDIYTALGRGRNILREAKHGQIKDMKFVNEFGQPIQYLDGRPEKFFLGNGVESFVYNNPSDPNTVLKLTHSLWLPNAGLHRLGFKTPEEAMQFAQKRAEFARKHPAQLPIKPVGITKFDDYYFPITMQPKAITDATQRNSAFHKMQRFVERNIDSVGDAHNDNFGFVNLSDGTMAPIGIDLAPQTKEWSNYVSELRNKGLAIFGIPTDRGRIHLSGFNRKPFNFIQTKPLRSIIRPGFNPIRTGLDVLPAQRFPGLRNFSAIGNDPVHLFGVRDRMIAKPEIMAKAMIKEGNVRKNPKIRGIGLDFLNAIQKGEADAADKAWLRLVDYNKK